MLTRDPGTQLVSQTGNRFRMTAWQHVGIAFSVLLACGCTGGDGVNLGTVSGIVTLDGEPLANASVSFHPAEGRGSFGRTDADGRYELKYMKSKGAILGTHQVTITSKVWAETSRTPGPGQTARSMSDAAAAQSRPEILPEKYRERETTVLTAEVVAGTNEFNFPLKSE